MPVTIFDRVRASFAQQQFMTTLGATLLSVNPGAIEIAVPFRADLTQQNGFLHAGVITSILDSACGYAALSVAPENFDVLSVEFKVNLLSPAVGERFVARSKVNVGQTADGRSRGCVRHPRHGRKTDRHHARNNHHHAWYF